MKVMLIKIIEALASNDRDRALDYAKHLIDQRERWCRTSDTIWNTYDLMTARNILHVLKGEPKEGGIAVCD